MAMIRTTDLDDRRRAETIAWKNAEYWGRDIGIPVIDTVKAPIGDEAH